MRKVEHECGIYTIYNTVTNKCYIGKSKDMQHRWHEHRSKLMRNEHNNIPMQEDWNKQNGEGFVFYPLVVTDSEDLALREMEFVALFHTTDPKFGYNQVGGHNGMAKSSKEYLFNKSEAMKRHYASDPEAVAKRRASINKVLSTPEYKEKASIRAKEIHSRPEIKAKLRATWDSEEYRKRISESHKGIKPSAKTVQLFMERTCKPVRCIETGVVYPSASEASRSLPGNKNIQAVAEGRRKTAGGYHWEYYDEKTV